MKTDSLNNLKKIILIGLLTTSMMFLFATCSQKVTFLDSSVVPAAEGNVKIKKDNNDNYNIRVEIANLARVQKVEPNKNYIVWMETDEGRTANLGQLNSSTSFLSSKLKASLETVSSFEPTRIFVTAENSRNIQYPSGQIIMSTSNFNH